MALTNENCPVCKSTSSRLLYDVRRPKAHANGLHGYIRRCNGCNLIFKTFEGRATEVYDEQYAEGFVNNADYSGAAASSLYSNILKPSFERVKDHSQPPKLLDIGSGFGMMLQTAKSMGFHATGVEFCKPLADRAREQGFNVCNCDVADMQSDLMFDTITMMDIIEHLVDPVTVLESLRARLKPTGELILYTPDHSSMIVSVASWLYSLGRTSAIDNIFACTHTCFFTSKTLKDTAGRAGFEVLQVRTLPYDTSRTGQTVSAASKIIIKSIEGTGHLLGYNGFRVVLYAKPK